MNKTRKITKSVEVLFEAHLLCPICGRRLVFRNGVLIQPRHKRGEGPLELLQPSGCCDRCGEHIVAPVEVEKHIASSADSPLFILKARGTIPKASLGGFVRLFIIEGEEFVYSVEDWRPTEELCAKAAPLARRRR